MGSLPVTSSYRRSSRSSSNQQLSFLLGWCLVSGAALMMLVVATTHRSSMHCWHVTVSSSGGPQKPRVLAAALQQQQQQHQPAAAKIQLDSCPSRVTPFPQTFWYVKTHKTGSSTLAGVFRSISAHYGVTPVRRDLLYTAQRDLFQPGRSDTANHTLVKAAVDLAYEASEVSAVGIVNHLKFSQKRAALLKPPALLFSSVRHPLSRIYSQLFDDMCWSSLKPRGPLSDKNLCMSFNHTSPFGQMVMRKDTPSARMRYITKYAHNHCFNYMRGNASTPQEALAQYDFVFVSERMDEALVAFMMLYGLTYEDIAYLRAKNKKGLYKTAADSPKHMNDYIESHNKIDIELWNLANARLDSTIEKLKREDAGACFERHLAVFAAVQAAVKAGCRDYQRFHAEHGLSNQTYSYVSDNGIGFRCVRHVTREFLRAAHTPNNTPAVGVGEQQGPSST